MINFLRMIAVCHQHRFLFELAKPLEKGEVFQGAIRDLRLLYMGHEITSALVARIAATMEIK